MIWTTGVIKGVAVVHRAVEVIYKPKLILARSTPDLVDNTPTINNKIVSNLHRLLLVVMFEMTLWHKYRDNLDCEVIMKAMVLVLLVITCGLLTAVISPFSLVGEGNFAGKMGAYVSGDTITFVTKPPIPNTIRYHYSFNGGVTWQTTDIIPFQNDDFFTPTLSHSLDETIVSFKRGQGNWLAISDDGETFGDLRHLPSNSFDPSPYVEKCNGQYKSFSLDLPYPEKIVVDGETREFPGIHRDDPDEFIAPFHYTDSETNPEVEPEYFTGTDVINGIVRTNQNLYIKLTDEGTNLGWPIFNSPVVIGGHVVSTPPDYPRDMVFRGGLIENSPPMELGAAIPPSGHLHSVGPPTYDPNTIIMVNVQGTGYTAMMGRISMPRRVFTDVWPTYPEGYPYVTPTFRNNFTVCDTVWTHLGGGTSCGRINYVNNKLWIRGTFQGNQTWWSSQDIELIGDITISGTFPPDDPYYNRNSMVNLVSDKNIIVKYGYRDPCDSLRYHPNVGADGDYEAPAGGGIWIYASLYAMGYVGGDPAQDGVFTFEYQHPHPSVPAAWYSIPDEDLGLFEWIDLHRNRYPQTISQPWPANIDYPWYNPLWPEAKPYLERGTVNVWGSVFQRRRGIMHRDYDGNGNGSWNFDMGSYGGSSSPELGYVDPALGVELRTRNYPGAEGNGIGYKKNYNPDKRSKLSFGLDANDAASIWNLGLNLSNYNALYGEMESYYKLPYARVPHEKCFARKGERAYYSISDQLIYADDDAVTDISGLSFGDGVIRSIAIKPDSSPFICQLAVVDSMYNMTVKDIDAATEEVNYEHSFTVPTMINDVCVLPNGRRLMAKFQSPNTIGLWEITPFLPLNNLDNWQIDATLIPSADVLKTSRLYMLPSGNSRVEVFFYIPADTADSNANGALYHAYANFPVSNEDYTVPAAPAVKFTAYPNPMRGELKLQVENAKAASLSIDVYNIKGQLVRGIPLAAQADNAKIEYTWNGTDGNNQRVANGVYMLRLMVNDKAVVTKRICRY